MATGVDGVPPNSLGDTYDVAIGLDPVNGTAHMVGYCLPPTGQWQVTSVLDYDQSYRSTASPNQTDARDLTPFPKVSQGDWSGGERQVFFVDPTRYYSSAGLDTSQAGHLKCFSALVNYSVPANVGTLAFSSMDVSDGAVYIGAGSNGLAASAGNLLIVTPPNTVVASAAVGPLAAGRYPQILGVLCVGEIVYCATPVGVYAYNTSTAASVQVTNDQADTGIGYSPMMGELGGKVYYVCFNGGQQEIRGFALPYPGAAPGTVAITFPGLLTDQSPPDTQAGTAFLLSDGASIVYGINLPGSSDGPINGGYTNIYRFDGSASTLVGRVEGPVMGATAFGGVTYLMAARGVVGAAQPQYLLFSLSGSALTLMDDTRYVPTVFQNSTTSGTSNNNTLGYLSGDGKFLYAYFGGLGLRRYDVSTGAVTTIGGYTPTSSDQMAYVCCDAGIVLVRYHSPFLGPFTNNIAAFDGSALMVGTQRSSYIDFNTPSVVKTWRSVEIALNAPLPTNASVGVSYRLDSQTSDTALTVQPADPFDLVAIFPPGVKGSRIQLLLTLTPGSNQTPDVASYSVKANLGRVWSTTVMCRRGFGTRNPDQRDPQGKKGVDLLANIEQIYDNAGKCVLFVPSPKAGPAATIGGVATPYIEQVNAELLKYQFVTGPNCPAYRQTDDGLDMEADVSIVLAESL